MSSLDKEFKEFEHLHRQFIVAYTLLTTKKVKSRAVDARKALGEMGKLTKKLRATIQEYKSSI